jgi:AP-2 complex subunit mu-1
MFTASGLIVRFLKVFEKSNYQSIKWVRYLTKASGNYQIRVSEVGLIFGLTTDFITPTVLDACPIY